MNAQNHYLELRKIDCSAKVEKKNGLSYLSWPFAVDELLQRDPSASWEYPEPKQWGETWMVFCSVTAFGRTRTAQLPVMDHRNKSIPNPDSFAVNTAMQRCLVKAIALHGLGLYIYAGEDLPGDAETKSNGNGHVHDPNEMATGISDQQARQTTSQMIAVLDANVDDQVKALRAAELHQAIRTFGGEPLYRAAWKVLKDNSGARSKWKNLLDMAAQ